jgi:hypothetical protein
MMLLVPRRHTDSTLDNKKTFVFEHLDGPVVQKEDGTFENTEGELFAIFPSNDSENEEMSYTGSGSDNGMLVEPKKKSLK